MKKFRRLTSAIAALAIAATMAIPMSAMMTASAASATITVSVDATDDGVHTYEAYQIFGGAAVDKTLSNVTWGSGVKTDSITNIYNDLFDYNPTLFGTISATEGNAIENLNTEYTAWLADNTGKTLADYLKSAEGKEKYTSAALASAQDVADALGTASDDSEVAFKFADIVAKYLSTTKTTATASSGVTNGTKNVITVDADGYYLVQDANTPTKPDGGANAGSKTRYLLEVIATADTANNYDINEKAGAPEVMKKVKDDEGNEIVDYLVHFGNGKVYTHTPSEVEELTKYKYDTENGYTEDENGVYYKVKEGEYAEIVEAPVENILDTDLYDNYQISETGYSDVADYSIGEDVEFQLYGSLPENLDKYDTYKYIFHDKLGSTLKFKANTVEVYVERNGQKTKINSGYEVVTSTSDGDTFEVKFDDLKSAVSDLKSSDVIIVYYKAELTGDAWIGLPGQENEVQLEYSNNPNWDGTGDEETGKTEKDKVIVFTYELDLTKVDGASWDTGDEEYKTKLKNAEFVLQDKDNNYVLIDEKGIYRGTVAATSVTNNKYTETAWLLADNTVVRGTEPSGTKVTEDKTLTGDEYKEITLTITLVSDENGLFKIAGLDEGTYTLTETKAPEGYNALTAPVTLEVVADTMDENTDAEAGRQYWADKYHGEGSGDTYEKNNGKDALLSLKLKVNGGAAKDGSVETGKVSATIENKKGSSLPSTGGIGTTLFYVVGGALVTVAGVSLITKKRVGEAE